MAAKRFKQQPEGDEPQARRSASRHMASGAAGGEVPAGSSAPRRASAPRFRTAPDAARAGDAAPYERTAAPRERAAASRHAAVPEVRSGAADASPCRAAASDASSRSHATAGGQRRRGSRFADASRATASSHRFSQLGGNESLGVSAGEVPVTSSSSDEGLGASFGTDDAPRPIGVDPSVTGSFHTITPGHGAVLSTRETAARAAEAAREALPDSEDIRVPEHHRRRATAGRTGMRREAEPSASSRFTPARIAAVAVGALVVLIVLYLVLSAALSSWGDGGAIGDDAMSSTADTPATTSVPAGDTINLTSTDYGVTQGEDGSWAFTRSSAGETSTICQLQGTPVSVSLYQGTFFVPENLPDGTWDIISYMAADGAIPGQLLGDDGQPVTGEGELSSATLDGGTLTLTTTDGNVTNVPLS